MEDKLQKIVNQYIDPNSPTFGNAYRSALQAGYEENTAAVITTYIDDTDQQLEVINIMTEEIKKTQKKIVNMLEELISLTYEEKEKEIKKVLDYK